MKLDNTTKYFIKIDKKYKEDKNNEKINQDFDRFPHRRDYKYGWDINVSAGHLSFKCSVHGSKFGGLAKIYNTYRFEMKNKILTNNGKHDAAVTPNRGCVDWNYGSARPKKRSMKVAIINHIARMQQSSEYPALLNVNKDNGYSLGSITNHDLTYVP